MTAPKIEPKLELKKEVKPKEQDWKQKVFEVIATHEGHSLTAYCDTYKYIGTKYVKNCKSSKDRRSIGYGTISYRGEKISESEVNKRLNEHLLNNVFPKVENKTCFSDNEKVAIADFIYNSGLYTLDNKKQYTFYYYITECKKTAIKSFLNPKNYVSKGLQKRREVQYNYFTNKKA